MLQSSLKSLHDFGISPTNGFLPDQLPLPCLPDSYYKPWEAIVQNLPALIKNKRFREEAESLPLLLTSKLRSEREWQRAYVVLSFLAHGYIWGGEMPSEVSIAAPLSIHNG
jgi:indoleamine 2,3-dioxygenase